ncbi:MAG: archaeosortase A [Halobacteriaceae archaeon]
MPGLSVSLLLGIPETPVWGWAVSDALAWVAILTFLAGALLSNRRTSLGRTVSAAAWVLFALFWLQLVPHFAFGQKSFVEGALSLAAVPASLYTGHLLYRGRDSLLLLSRSVAYMGLIYLPFQTIPAFTVAGVRVPAPRRVLIETVAAQAGSLIHALGHDPTLIRGDEYGYWNTYEFIYTDGTERARLVFTVVLACTGIGSMTIFGGLIAAVRAPLRRKVRALAIAIPVIYLLNILRVTFIGVAFGKQYMQWFVPQMVALFGLEYTYDVSFIFADRIVSQILAVVALVGVTYLVVREVPELLSVIEDVLYLATGDEYDLARHLDLPAVKADGGEQTE